MADHTHSGSAIYPQLLPEIEDWPINKLYARRKDFVEAIDRQVVENLVAKYGEEIDKPIARTIYLEKIRLKEDPWKVDPPNEKQFWKRIRKDLGLNAKHRDDVKFDRDKELLRRIVHRYSDEIVGDFHKKTFKFARKFLTAFFKRLLNTASGRNMGRIWGTRYNLYERIRIYGDVEKVRHTFSQGTVVVVPTHFSNLDSVLIGYALDQIVGLPSFSYGAGLNLYNSELFAYYMGRLGAYRVDRRKRNAIYLETLKTMSNLSLQWGVNSLFFPEGTRSRSGSIEKELKLGLLNSLVEAQRTIYGNGENQKVIVVPLVLGYHFVLEARSLIDQHLSKSGQEKFMLVHDEFKSFRKIAKFVWQFFSQSSEIILSFGEPVDVLGNRINDAGESIDDRGKVISIKEYFTADGDITKNMQRESVYTRLLAKRICENYYRNNVVLSSHLVTFAAFEILCKLNPELDIFGLLRLPNDDFTFSRDLLLQVVEQLLDILSKKELEGEVKLSEILKSADADTILQDGMDHSGLYHVEKPLTVNKRGELISQNFKLLYYYHNRLENYELAEQISWPADMVDAALELIED